MHLIYQYPSGGKLFQSGYQEIPANLKKANIDYVIFAAKERPPTKQFKCGILVYAPLEDNFFPTTIEYQYIQNMAGKTANGIVEKIKKGKNVLTTCAKGLNRSGLINALVLRMLTNCSPQDAINLIRKQRNPIALSNPAFLKIIKT